MASAGFEPPPPPLKHLDQVLRELCEEVLDAAINIDNWVPWLVKVAREFQATVAHVALYDFEHDAVLLHALASEAFSIPPSKITEYEIATPVDERGALAAAFPGRALTTQDWDPRKVAHIPIVQIAPPELAQMMLVNDLAEPFWAFVSVLKHRDDPPFTPDQRARLAALGTYFSRAMCVFRAWQASEATTGPVIGIIEAATCPLALLRDDGTPLIFNQVALDCLGLRSKEHWQPPAGLKRILSGLGGQLHDSIDLVTPHGSGKARLSKLPGPHGYILMELHLDADSPTFKLDIFCAHYGLTRSERTIVEGLSDGLALHEVSELLGRSHETVRAQIRSIREKTGLGSQRAILAALEQHFVTPIAHK